MSKKPGNILELKDQIIHYRKVNHLTYKEFCNEVFISNEELAALQCGDYSVVSDDILEDIAKVVYEL